MVTFGMGLSIPEDELDLCHELANTAYLTLGLTNDLFSWQKEYETAVAMGQDYVVNVISVLMEEHGISEEEAKAICREKIKVTVVDYRKIVKDTNERDDVSVDLKRYLEALLYSLSGNLVWSLECPRYHRGASYNERQLDWMKNGVPQPDKISTHGASPHKNGSLEPKTTKRNGVNKEVGSPSRFELANVSNRLQDVTGDDPSSNGMVDTSLVNIFVAKNINSLDGVKFHDKNTAPPSAGAELHPDGVLQQDMEDSDAKVKPSAPFLNEHC